MPRTVAVGVWLIGTALAIDVVGTLLLRGLGLEPIIQVAILICLFGGLLAAIAYRRNWARLTFAFLFVVALPFSIIAMSRAAAFSPTTVALSATLAVLQGIGLICLFLRKSSEWYHGDRAA